MVLNLVQKNPTEIVEMVSQGIYEQYFGCLVTPLTQPSKSSLSLCSNWAMDNGCFGGCNVDAIIKLLTKYQGVPNCRFAALPDVVKDHSATYHLSMEYFSLYKELGYSTCFVLQDGCPVDFNIEQFDAVFIGGSDGWKYSDMVKRLCERAKANGQWIHHGRVNTVERICHSIVLGCDSFDGTSYIMHRQKLWEMLPIQNASLYMAEKVRDGILKSQEVKNDKKRQPQAKLF